MSLEELIKTSGVPKSRIAKSMNISPQWLSTLLSKDTNDLTINQLSGIVRAIGFELSVSVDIIL